MPNHPWYDEVPADTPLTQGDIIEACPVVVFSSVPNLSEAADLESLMASLSQSAGLDRVRAIVMTQACDLAQGKVRNVILCPIYHLSEYKALWEEKTRSSGHTPNQNQWSKLTVTIRDGKVWNLTMLRERNPNHPAGEGLTLPHQIVDFHEIFSVPLEFLSAWVTKAGINRLRLQPPYREHLSQSFARYFMRVGLPQEIELR